MALGLLRFAAFPLHCIIGFCANVMEEDLGADTNGREWTREEEATMSARAPIAVQAMKASSRDDKVGSFVADTRWVSVSSGFRRALPAFCVSLCLD